MQEKEIRKVRNNKSWGNRGEMVGGSDVLQIVMRRGCPMLTECMCACVCRCVVEY